MSGMKASEKLHAYAIRALQPPPIPSLDAVYIMNEVPDLDEALEGSVVMLEPYKRAHSKMLITGHDPGDPQLREDGRFNASAVPIVGGTVLGERLLSKGVVTEMVYGSFEGYADSGKQFNTQTELRSIARYMQHKGWRTFAIFAPDVHATRIAITMISVLKEIGAGDIFFWIIQAPTGGWDREMQHSGGGKHDSGYAVVQKELAKYHGHDRYGNLVPVADTFAYFDRRDRWVLNN